MNNEIVTESHIIPAGTEVSFGVLTTPHQFTQITVNAAGSALANGTLWRLYSITAAGAALIQECALQKASLASKRLLHNIEDGALVELRGYNPNDADTLAITTSLVGSDPSCCDGAPAEIVAGGRVILSEGVYSLQNSFGVDSIVDGATGTVDIVLEEPTPDPYVMGLTIWQSAGEIAQGSPPDASSLRVLMTNSAGAVADLNGFDFTVSRYPT